MFCNKCGSENRNDRKFCTNCGAPLRDYTKPRENLIMPEEISNKQTAVAKINKLRLITNIIMTLFLIIAISFAIVSFYVKDNLILTFAILAFVCIVIVIVTYIIKVVLIKKFDKAFKN